MEESDRATRFAIILNPAAGRGQGGGARKRLEALLEQNIAALPDRSAVSVEIIETSAPGDGSRLAARAVDCGAQVVVAAGGDGTLGEVVNGAAGSGALVGLLPLGTGNDFARGLGLHRDLDRMVHALFHGRRQLVDLGRTRDRWFINAAGCGFDAIVAERVNRGFRYLRGTSAYIAAVIQSLTNLRSAAMRITLDGETRELRGLMCAIANAPMYGGGMKIAPLARIDDGWLDICILGEAGRWEFLRAFPRVFSGTHAAHPKVTMLRARRILVESDPPLPVLVDGEVIGPTPAEFTIAPGALTLLIPA